MDLERLIEEIVGVQGQIEDLERRLQEERNNNEPGSDRRIDQTANGIALLQRRMLTLTELVRQIKDREMDQDEENDQMN